MPELPEVQAAVDYLRKRVVGCRIIATKILWGRSIAKLSPATFIRRLKGCSITEVFRRGKYICAALSSARSRESQFLFIHLRMSGSVDVLGSKIPVDPYDRVIFELDSGKTLRFNDVRKFGKISLVNEQSVITDNLGPEPLDGKLTDKLFYTALQCRKRRIKPLLLDQAFLAGVGNIYADEALWSSSLHPATLSHQISEESARLLLAAIRTILLEAISLAGTDFGDGVVSEGMYRPKVYGRAKSQCYRCGKGIVRLVVAQRGTHICPHCQKQKKSSSQSTGLRRTRMRRQAGKGN